MSKAKEVSRQEPKRTITFRDLVFLSLGGQSPFLSVLTYGVVAFIIAGAFGPIAIILGTLLVLVNGLVVYKLSTRFTESGGYYTYAFYSLTKRLGFETGWVYLVYSTLYGSAYVLGSSYVISHVLPVSPWLVALLIFGVSSVFAVLGIKPTAMYAVIASLIEISIMGVLAVLFLKSTNFTFYNPFSFHIPISQLTLAILFGSSIPTGYGSITPLSGEVKNPKRTVPLAIITVILLGGLLASFDVYAISDHLIFYHLSASKVDFLRLIEDKLGIVTLIFVLFAAANDGILATLSFMLATSRTAYSMAVKGFLPNSLAKFEPSKGPFNAVLLAILLYGLSVFLGLDLASGNAFLAFEAIGEVAVLSNLFVHLASDFSLLKISAKRFRKRLPEISLSIGAAAFTVYSLVYSISGSTPSLVYAFMTFIIMGFLAAEVIYMSKEEQEER